MKKAILLLLAAVLLCSAILPVWAVDSETAAPASSLQFETEPVISYPLDGTDGFMTGFEDYEGSESRKPANAKASYENRSFIWSSEATSGGGFNLNTGDVLPNPDVYTIAMSFSFEKTGVDGNRYRKILSFKDYNDDSGLYFLNGKPLYYYYGDKKANTVVAQNGQPVLLIVTRDAENRFKVYYYDTEISAYIKVCDYDDSDGHTIIENNRLGFFYDDNKGIAGEATPGGTLYSLQIWDTAVSEEEICRAEDKQHFNGHTYQVFSKEMNPIEAEEYCEALGGHLVTVTSEEEQSFVSKLAEANGVTDYIIGALDTVKEGEWRWVTDEAFEYTNWASGEPNNGLGAGENYCIVSESKDWKWVDFYGGYDNYQSQFGFVCEWDNLRTTYDSEVSEWSSPEMEEAYTKGLVPETLIGEDLTAPVSRGEFAAVSLQLYEALTGKTAAKSGSPFTDITADNNKDAIERAYGLNIVAGVSKTSYDPASGITREQLATMLCRTIKKYKFPEWTLETDADYFLDSAGVKKFSDDADISDYAKPSVYYMVKMGIISGIDETHFAPRNVTTEQEAAGYASATREQAIALSLRTYKISELLK